VGRVFKLAGEAGDNTANPANGAAAAVPAAVCSTPMSPSAFFNSRPSSDVRTFDVGTLDDSTLRRWTFRRLSALDPAKGRPRRGLSNAGPGFVEHRAEFVARRVRPGRALRAAGALKLETQGPKRETRNSNLETEVSTSCAKGSTAALDAH
jgi:hypothetical protein